MKRTRFSAPLAWAALLAGILMVHFFLTFLYLTPNNPVKNRHWDSLHAYMDPLFAQNWKLFAPNPVSQHREVWAKARIRDPVTGEIRETGWKNVTRPMVRERQNHRISSEGRVLRFLISGSRDFKSEDPEEKEKGSWMLQRATSTYLGEVLPGETIQQIKFRVVTDTFPRFDERHKADGSTLHFAESDWLGYRPVPSGPAKEWPR
ncbi:hypothetical protein C8P63_108107 [Melghirimyces profundicolus]|uniref:Uncharacterized protein n=1 Tax=Melghirimyces profundicolus TaxID=1242148 RepID=A0A2T6BXU8_9BACL|nr:DUF5819 family protein [Melghirimyces profundicolus]PTX60797.1 hypothetical protein C8P63_108107 [Melghirimyces profundicolus]